jgi:Ni/Co efflux regulator RcnB
MKALLTAFALLSFVAASTVPYAAQAQTMQTQSPTKSKTHKKHKTSKKSGKKHVAQAKKHKSKKKMPIASTARG